jgi:hypothetical protein
MFLSDTLYQLNSVLFTVNVLYFDLENGTTFLLGHSLMPGRISTDTPATGGAADPIGQPIGPIWDLLQALLWLT